MTEDAHTDDKTKKRTWHHVQPFSSERLLAAECFEDEAEAKQLFKDYGILAKTPGWGVVRYTRTYTYDHNGEF